jgi:selenocysteine lyase/cysteine desulfurase
MVPIDVVALGVDFLAAGAHKWLMGLEGAGFLYARPERARALVPRTAGWLSHVSPIDFLFEGQGKLVYDKPIRDRIDFLESGNAASMSFAALEAALDPVLELGVAEVFAHVQRWHDAVEPGAKELGFESVRAPAPEGRSGTLSLLAPPGVRVTDVHRELEALGVACAVPDGHLRFSPHWPNALDEAEQVLLSLQEALSRARKASA